MDDQAHINALLSELEVPPVLNKQLYENAPESILNLRKDYQAGPDALYADKAPNLLIKHEKPEHRIILFLKAQGLSNREIAKRTGKTEPWISQVLRQPWARQRLVKELQEAGTDAVQEIIKASAEDSVFTLIEVRDSEKSKPSERTAAANSLLDRYLGKPTQKVETHNVNVSGSLQDIEEIDREMARLSEEEKALTGRN